MPLIKDYVSKTFSSMPDNIGHLAIHITEHQCTFAICSSTGVLVFLRSVSKPKDELIHLFIKDVFAEHQILLSKQVETTTIGISTSNFTITPQTLNAEPKEIMDFLTGSPTRKAFKEPITELNSDFIYSIPQPLLQVIEQNFTKFKLIPATKLAIPQALQCKANCFLVFELNHFDCFIIKDGKLQSVNRHRYATAEDVVYFVGLSLKDAKIENNNAHVIASGSIKKHSSEFNSLYKYFNTVEVKNVETSISVRPDFGSPQQEYQYVLNLLNANY